ncbi:MAG: glycosyltransferase family 2 protein [Lachnospiraceae bacterium]|nr:glycosyltransferase family 2 protein [Lachnospiraceae bacterium]
MSINLIMPMGGAGTRFANLGYDSPKPLIDLNGRHFFEYAADSVREHCDVESITFVVLREHIESFGIDKEVLKYAPDAGIVVLDHVLNGAVLTCMRGADAVNNDLPLIFCDCDLMFRSEKLYSYIDGREEGTGLKRGELDGWLLTFENSEGRFSYVRTDEKGFVTETREKEVISSRAVCGAYGFGNKELFISYAEKYMDNCPYNEYFMSGIYNLMIDEGKRIGEFPTDEFLSFGTPDEYEKAREILKNAD